MFSGQYNKLWIALIGAGVQLVSIYFPTAEWVPVLIAFLTAIGVFQVPNKVSN